MIALAVDLRGEFRIAFSSNGVASPIRIAAQVKRRIFGSAIVKV